MVQRIGGRLGLVAVVVAAGVACQPVDDDPGRAADESTEDADEFGAADYGLAAFWEVTEPLAQEWDSGARLVETSVRLDEDLRWRQGAATFVAPDADRMLIVDISDEGLTEQETTTLETLGFVPPPEEALERVPELPDDAIEPQAAVQAAEEPLDECDISGDPTEVLYRTGAPAAWDGTRWEPEPAWSVAVLAEAGGVVLEPDGTVREDGCYEMP